MAQRFGTLRALGCLCFVAWVGALGSAVGQAPPPPGGWCGTPTGCDNPNVVCADPPEPPCTFCRIPPEGAVTCPTCTHSPNYVKTGVYETTEQDLSLPAAGFTLEAFRHYDSTSRTDGVLGVGWRLNLAAHLYYATYATGPGSITRQASIRLPSGGIYLFAENSDGATYTGPAGRYDSLVKNPDGSWTFTIQRTSSKYQFSPTGALLSKIDDYGNVQNYTLDANDQVQQVQDLATGRYINVYYGADGRVSSLQDSSNRQVQYQYNAQGLISSVTDPQQRTKSYTYTQGRFIPILSEVKDNWGRVLTDISYDAQDRTHSYSEDGETYTYDYNHPSETWKSDSLGNTWRLHYDGNGLITQIQTPYYGGSNYSQSFTTYNPDGSTASFRDFAQAIMTCYGYDSGGRVTYVTRGANTSCGGGIIRFNYAYDPGFPEKVTSVSAVDPTSGAPRSDWESWQYDYFQAGSAAPGALAHAYRMETDGHTRDTVAGYTYDSLGRVLSMTTGTGGETDYVYDSPCGLGNLCSVTSPSNNDSGTRPAIRYAYDSLGRVTSVTDANGKVTSYSYDGLGRVLSVTLPKPSPDSPLDFTTTYGYDNFDVNTDLVFTTVTDPNGIATRQGYDQFGHLVQGVDALGGMTGYAYTRGLLSSITDANGNVTGYTYDSMRRLASTVFPDNATESYVYNFDNTMSTMTDRKNTQSAFSYDWAKRLVERQFHSGGSSLGYILNTYEDSAGHGERLTSVNNTTVSPSETHTLAYDASYRLASEAQATRGTVTYSYNPDDTLASYSVQGGPTASYTRYPDGSVDTITWSLVAGEFKYTYYPSGQYQAITFPNGQSRSYSYDDQGRLLQLANAHPSAGNLATYGYDYDYNYDTGTYTRLGQRTALSATVPAQSLNAAVTRYSYDNAYQLTSAQYPSGEVDAWTYDAIGNRLTNTMGNNTLTYTYFKNGTNPNNGQRLQSDGANSYTFDPNGNTMAKTGSQSYTFGWDVQNRMNSISGATAASYAYDYQGRRSFKTVSGATTTYLYQGLNLVRETGSSSADYLFGPGIDEPLAMSRGGQVYYYDVDGLGSVGLVNDSGGNVQDSYVFDAWGNIMSQTGSLGNPFGYTGREFGDTGADWFYRARYYDPGMGRFGNEDPLRWKSGNNFYAYVHNAPPRSRDPLGLIAAAKICCDGKGGFKICWLHYYDIELLNECDKAHEEDHITFYHNHEDLCPQCRGKEEGFDKFAFSSWQEYQESECEAFVVQLTCLRRGMRNGGPDTPRIQWYVNELIKTARAAPFNCSIQ